MNLIHHIGMTFQILVRNNSFYLNKMHFMALQFVMDVTSDFPVSHSQKLSGIFDGSGPRSTIDCTGSYCS